MSLIYQHYIIIKSIWVKVSRVPYPNPQKVGKIQKSLDFFQNFLSCTSCGLLRKTRNLFMKKTLPIIVFICMLALLLFGCDRQETLLNPQKPVTLTMWHVYGEQADSPMNRYVEDFNRTVGKEKGIIVNVTLMSNASQIGQKLVNAQNGVAGVPAMPDLFFCHNSNAQELGANNLLDWQDVFSASELSDFIGEFVSDGMVDNSLSVLPVSKSTHLLFLAGGAFDKFAKEQNVTYANLATWDGFFSVAEKYYNYSGGKPFCALDYLMRSVELDAISHGAVDFYQNDWYKQNDTLLASYKKFAEAIAKGHIVVSDLYSNTQVMTGQTIAGISSSAAVLYYNDTITYPNNTQEPTNLKVLPVPTSSGKKYATQAGVGLCAYKTTPQKAEAATAFAKWFTEEKRNLDFVAQTGYMPVKNGAFDKLESYTFKTEAFRNTYAALKSTVESCTFLSEPSMAGYFPNTYTLYSKIRALQKELPSMYENGKTEEEITDQLVDMFLSIPAA